MNHEEIIEKIYDISAVEGLAWFEQGGNLVENQLSISEEAVQKIGEVIFLMRSNLAVAARDLRGLVIKSGAQTFINYIHGNTLILLEVDSAASLDDVYSALKSQLGESKEVVQLAPVNTGAAAESAQVQEEEVLQEGDIPWDEFYRSMLVQFKKVAPAQLAKKLIAESCKFAGVAESSKGVSLEQATSIATEASKKIPNQARREMLQKELQALLAKYSS